MSCCDDEGCGPIPRPRRHPNAPAPSAGTTKRVKKSKKSEEDEDDEDSHSDTNDADDEGDHSHNNLRKASTATKGYNYTAIGILLLFIIPVLLTGFIYVSVEDI